MGENLTDWLGENSWAIWLSLAFLLAVAEVLSLDLVLIMLAVGALAGAAVAVVTPGLWWLQILTAAAVSVLMLLLLRPVVRGKLLTTVDRTNADRILDQTAIVIQTIDAKQETGQIRLMGQIWSARAADPNDCIPEGETVVVTAISGVKAIVKRV